MLLVAHRHNSQELLPQLPHSGLPFLLVSAEQIGEKRYQRIAVPVGCQKKSKDLALWGRYFDRHNGAKISLIHSTNHFEEDKNRVFSIFLSRVPF